MKDEQQCLECGGKKYLSDKYRCCKGKLRSQEDLQGMICCDDKWVEREKCCDNKILARGMFLFQFSFLFLFFLNQINIQSGQSCCWGKAYSPTTERCC